MFAIILPRLETTPRAREAFTVVFYGTGIFGCKTAQVSETPRESVRSGFASEKQTAQHGEKPCKIR